MLNVLRRDSSRVVAIVGIAGLVLAGFLFSANSALAGVGLGVSPSFPSTVVVGNTNVPVSLAVTNNSDGGDGNPVDLTGITLIPSCGANSGSTCTSLDPGVFSVDSPGTGADTCAGRTFTIAVVDAPSGKVSFTPDTTITLGIGEKCTINFTVDVIGAPDIDASGSAGLQTKQVGEASAQEQGADPLDGGGFGTDTTTVDKASPQISTTPVPASGAVGVELNDTATVTGGSSPTGNVTFKLFPPADSTCIGAPVFTEVDSAAPYTTVPGGYTSLVAGVYHWTADYAGDANNNAASSGCEAEPVTTTRTGSSTVTEIHDDNHGIVTSVTPGTMVHDKAIVTPSDATGTVSFQIYTGTDCVTTNGAPEVVAVAAGVAETTAVAANAGMSYKATYSGDAKYEGSVGACEPLTVDKLNSTVATAIHNTAHGVITSANPGDTVHDSASVTPSAATGDVTFDFWNNASCEGTPAATSGTFALSGGAVDATSFTHVVAAPGASFKAHYAGDSVYNPDEGDCEPLTVSKLDSSTRTDIHDANHGVVTSVPTGTTVHDKAFVTGSGATPTGNVSFQLYSDNNCTTVNGAPQVVALAGDGTAETSTTVANSSMSYKATYAGDATYNGSVGACEPLTVQATQGCSPGYWKQSQHFDSYPAGVTSSTLMSALGFENFAGKSILTVLSTGGGGLNALGRIIAGAYLNAATIPGYPGTAADVVAAFNAVHPGTDAQYNALKSQYEALQDPCPLN